MSMLLSQSECTIFRSDFKKSKCSRIDYTGIAE